MLLAFSALVSLRVHGSSLALSSQIWAPDTAMQHFVAAPLLARMQPDAAESWRDVLMAEPRYIRLDEWAHETPWALSQLTHTPRFPVINRNFGGGQNMLLLPWVPVAHVAAIARPMTWGYLLFGAQRGLAWAWWSQAFLCFIALYLLFEALEPGRPWLAVLGAGWYCASAYVVFWSLWPAYVTGLGVASVVCAYWTLRSSRLWVILASGLGVGVSFSAFVMQLYPPWQVPLGHTFLVLFAALFWRDRLWTRFRERSSARLAGIGLAVLSATLILGAFVGSSIDALRAFAQSDYPGQRRLLGGDTPAWRLFGGLYNAFMKDWFTPDFNPSEAAGFFLLFPAVLIAAAVSRPVRQRLGPVVWWLLPVAGLLILYCVTPVPGWLASVTLLSMAQGFRTQIALGLISIIVSVRLLAVTSELPRDRRAAWTAGVVLVGCAAFFLWQGHQLQTHGKLFAEARFPPWVLAVSLGAAVLSSCMALGWTRWFAGLLTLGLLATSATWNPLSIGFPDFRRSELGAAIRDITKRDGAGAPSLWLTYGGASYPNNGIIGQLMGARTLAGVYEYPQPDFWKPLDPRGKHRTKYNRYVNARLMPAPLGFRGVRFEMVTYLMIRVTVSALHPALRSMGARYVLTFGRQPTITSPPMSLLYTSSRGDFAIWELPPVEDPGGR